MSLLAQGEDVFAVRKGAAHGFSSEEGAGTTPLLTACRGSVH